jgi:hypothetical protein
LAVLAEGRHAVTTGEKEERRVVQRLQEPTSFLTFEWRAEEEVVEESCLIKGWAVSPICLFVKTCKSGRQAK